MPPTALLFFHGYTLSPFGFSRGDFLISGMIVLSDHNSRSGLYPFSATRHIAELRIGILTIREKWELLTGEEVRLVHEEIREAVPANLLPDVENYAKILNGHIEGVPYISRPWHIPQQNQQALINDFLLLTRNRVSAPIPNWVKVINPSMLFVEKNAVINSSIINASLGPVYIGEDTEIMEGCLIRGPFAMGRGSVLKMGTKIYGATTLGPQCTGGGEIKNSVLMGYSNKGHDGYLGDSVLGYWCNLGAGTSVSNVKNTGSDVWITLPGYPKEQVGNKAGLIMGDYSRSAINSSFNTGSMVGVCCSIHGHAQPKKDTPNFTWGEERYAFPKLLSDIANWKKMKGEGLSQEEIANLEELFKQT